MTPVQSPSAGKHILALIAALATVFALLFAARSEKAYKHGYSAGLNDCQQDQQLTPDQQKALFEKVQAATQYPPPSHGLPPER